MGLGARIALAFRCFFLVLFEGALSDDILNRFRPAVAPAVPVAGDVSPPPREDPGDRAVQLLAILQRDARLVDFLEEDLSAYDDAQIGAAVRDVHANGRAALHRYLTLEPVLTHAEGERMRVEDTTDPARVKLLGTVASGPQVGIVRHRGWRVTKLALPPLPTNTTREVIAPAEIEVA
jgi:hypothetical protein